jgi:MFS family permease
VDICGFFVAGFLITMGTLGDRIGRRRLLLIGAAAFGVASLLAALAHSAEALIAMRALLCRPRRRRCRAAGRSARGVCAGAAGGR